MGLIGVGAFLLVVGVLLVVAHFLGWSIGIPLLVVGGTLVVLGAVLAGGAFWWRTHYMRIPRRG